MAIVKYSLIVLISLHLSTSYNLTQIEKFNCTDGAIQCSNAGVCSREKDECECFEGYQTFFVDYVDYIRNTPRCNYKSKKQLYALLCALFLSFGSVHFYLENRILGYIQLVVFTLMFIFNVIIVCRLSIKHLHKLTRPEVKSTFGYIIIITLSLLIFFFWYGFDLIMVFSNVYKDNNNAHLESFL